MPGECRRKLLRFTVGTVRSKRVSGLVSATTIRLPGEALWVDDTFTERRYAQLADVGVAARLADALPHINLVGAMADPHDVPVSYRCVAVAIEQLKNTTKPIHFWFNDRASAHYVLEALIAVAGSAADAMRFPCTYPFLEPISPLKFPQHGIDLLFETHASGCRFP